MTLLACASSCSADEPGPALLFGPDEARLSGDQQRRIAAAFGEKFALTADGDRYEDANCGSVDPIATVVDLNGDGAFEVFIQWGNACTSGMTGRSLTLFLPGSGGGYRQVLGFPALTWTLLGGGDGDWPDLALGGPGFCHPVWTFRSGDYVFKCNLPDEPGGCASRDNVCPDG